MSHVGVTCAKGPSRAEGAAEGNANGKTCSPRLKAVRQRLRSVDAAGEGRSGGVEHLNRPGRRSHGESIGKENRGRWRDDDGDTDEEPLSAERVKPRLRRTERPVEGGQARCGRGAVHSSAALEAGDGSSASGTASDPQPLRPAAASASCPPSAPPPPRLPSRTSCEHLHHHPGASAREQDPFWAEVRATLAAAASSSHRQALVLSGPELREQKEEEGKDGGGSGAVAAMSQISASAAAAQACSPPEEEERKAGRRERNRIKYLRRRQRRRERWRLQESRQVSSGSEISECVCVIVYVCARARALSVLAAQLISTAHCLPAVK